MTTATAIRAARRRLTRWNKKHGLMATVASAVWAHALASDPFAIAIEELATRVRALRFGRCRATNKQAPWVSVRKRLWKIGRSVPCYLTVQKLGNGVFVGVGVAEDRPRAFGKQVRWNENLTVQLADPELFEKCMTFIQARVQAVAE